MKFLAATILALAILMQAGAAYAACFQYTSVKGGRLIYCVRCCDAAGCRLTCTGG